MVSILLSQPDIAVDACDEVWLTRTNVCANVHTHTCTYIKYRIARKFTQVKIFANFANYRLFTKILSTNVMFLLTEIGQ